RVDLARRQAWVLRPRLRGGRIRVAPAARVHPVAVAPATGEHRWWPFRAYWDRRRLDSSARSEYPSPRRRLCPSLATSGMSHVFAVLTSKNATGGPYRAATKSIHALPLPRRALPTAVAGVAIVAAFAWVLPLALLVDTGALPRSFDRSSAGMWVLVA